MVLIWVMVSDDRAIISYDAIKGEHVRNRYQCHVVLNAEGHEFSNKPFC